MLKPGIILLNLGSPDSPNTADVRRYLREFLMDERVLDAPLPVRWCLVHGLILPFRPKQSAKAYRSIWTEQGSPLLVISEKQRSALAKQVNMPVELGMRYGNPSTPAALQRLLDQGVQELFIIPMYPHYAMSSYETAVVHLMRAVRQKAPQLKTSLLPPFYNNPQYIAALVEQSMPYLEPDSFDKIIFSFHGVPERHMIKGDPSHSHCLQTPDCCNTCHPAHATCYRHQCAMTMEAFVKAAHLNKDQYTLTFQSRLGREPWLQPYTDKTLEILPRQGVKRLRVICPAFTADCLETLEEIADEGKETFLAAGGESFQHIPCLNDHPAFISFLSQQVSLWQQGAFTPNPSTPSASNQTALTPI
jgi:ferrochelatase